MRGRSGGAAPQVMRFGTPDNDIAGCSPPRAHYMPRCDSPASSDEGSPNSLPRTSVWPARLPGSTPVSFPPLRPPRSIIAPVRNKMPCSPV